MPQVQGELADAAYEKRSVAVSSNLHPAAFDELMPKTLATATVDNPAPRPRLPDLRRLRPALPGPRRKGSDATDLTHQAGDGHHRAEPMATPGHNP